MRAGRRDSLYDSNRDQFAAAISPKRGLLNAYTPTFTLCSTHHVHAHAACTRTISRPRCVRGWSRSKIDSVARIRPLQRCQLARCPRRERKGGGRTCTAYSGVSATLGMKRRAHIGKGAIVARRLRIRGGSWWRR